MARNPVAHPKETTTSLRVSSKDKAKMQENADKLGFKTISDYLRHLHEQSFRENNPISSQREWKDLETFHKTKHGKMFLGDSLDYLHNPHNENSTDLIVTSPPFGLVRKKSYGNEDAEFYCNWFRPFAEGFQKVLKDQGSLVIDIGGAWKPGSPTRSLYHFELLMMLCKEYGFHLCQEHYWWNPSKLPTPAEWVNIRRIRVKDAVNTVWWLSKTPYPKANNRRIVQPYSKSMKQLFKTGYKAKTRPSGHVISTKFSKDNGGSVPPNLLAIANTESNGTYQDYCRRNGIAIHPARFPSQLPEYFIRFLTEPGEFVLDPFGGSCVTGAVAETLERKWACIELNSEYLRGAISRFSEAGNKSTKAAGDKSPSPYSIFPPCSVAIDEQETPLPLDGGRARPKP